VDVATLKCSGLVFNSAATYLITLALLNTVRASADTIKVDKSSRVFHIKFESVTKALSKHIAENLVERIEFVT
jgi:hypothetical protein